MKMRGFVPSPDLRLLSSVSSQVDSEAACSMCGVCDQLVWVRGVRESGEQHTRERSQMEIPPPEREGIAVSHAFNTRPAYLLDKGGVDLGSDVFHIWNSAKILTLCLHQVQRGALQA